MRQLFFTLTSSETRINDVNGWVYNFRKSKVYDFEFRVRVFRLEEKVLRFEISMSNTHIVTIVQRLQNLLENLCCDLFGEELVFNNTVEELATAAGFSDQVDILLILEVLEELEHIWVVQLLQNRDLLLEPIHVLDLLLRHLLHCPLLLRLTMLAQ